MPLAPVLLAAASVLAADPQLWIFARTDCPISNRRAPVFERLYQSYSKAGVRFLLIYPEPGATKETVEKHREAYGLTIPYEIDAEQKRVRQAGVRVTPEVALFDAQGALAYRGRIDDKDAILGATKRYFGREYLQEALRAVLSGRKPAVRSTLGTGCAIERSER